MEYCLEAPRQFSGNLWPLLFCCSVELICLVLQYLSKNNKFITLSITIRTQLSLAQNNRPTKEILIL